MSAATVAPKATQTGAGTQSAPASTRVVLQRRAPRVIRRHSVRSALRVLALLSCDVTAYLIMRSGIRALRDLAVLGSEVAELTSALLPSGYFGGLPFAVALLGGMAVAGTYRPGDHRHDAKRLFAAVALAAALVLWQSLWMRGVIPVLSQYFVTVLGVGTGMTLGRLAVDRILSKLNGKVRPAERVLFLGDLGRSEPWSISTKLLKTEHMESVGWLTTAGSLGWRGSRRGEVQAVGSVDDIWSVLRDVQVDTVIICGSMPPESFDLVVEACAAAGCRLLAVSRYGGIGHLRPSSVSYMRMSFVELTLPAIRGQQILVKRALDILGASLGLLLLTPLFLVVSILIRLDSRGPIFYASRRWGHHGELLRMWKFRTMIDGAAAMLDKDNQLRQQYDTNIKIVDDPRITRVGKWLRRSSIDELPQLWNVLIGEMSLVGPRPKLINEDELYGPALSVVLGVRPGVTGLWQVSGRSSTSYNERISLDVDYVSRFSLWLDVKILLRTIPVVLCGQGAH